jgi:hypothetical protein
MPTFPRSPLTFRTAGFPSVRLQGWLSDGAFPNIASLKSAPDMHVAIPGLHPSFVHFVVASGSRPCRAVDPIVYRHEVAFRPQPQGSSLETGLCCPGPSSLNRPHPPHSQAHRDFTAERLIRDAFAVRERLGDPRVVPSFHWLFLPDMPSSASPGSSTSHCPIFHDADAVFATG